MITLAQTEAVGSPALNLAIFGGFVAVTLALVLRASKTNKSASDMYTGGAAFTGRQNGVAISGDYLSAASFLGIAGAIAINGYDGFLYSIGFLVAWLVALLLVAELLRNTGRFTMADVLSFRMRERPVRTAAATSSGVPVRFAGIASMTASGTSSVMSVAMKPGATALTVTPRRATSVATVLVMPIRPAFAAA